MSSTVKIQELAIVIATQSHNPTLLTPDFLKYSGITPEEWELARQPINSASAAQVTFQNGVEITAQRDRVIFAQAFNSQSSPLVPDLVCQYVNVLPKMDYRAIGINPRGHAILGEAVESPRRYITQTLLAPGAWQNLGDAPMQASMQLTYQLGRAQFSLTITEAAIQRTEQSLTPVVLFSGNFSYSLARSTDQPAELTQIVQNWQTDLNTFESVINSRFLDSTEPVFEAVTAYPVLPLVQ